MSEIKYTPVFEANKKAAESRKYRVIANEGSTRSSKTVSITQLLALYIPNVSKKSISIVSPSLPHLKRGARRDFINALQMAGTYFDNDFNKTDQIYNYPDSGSYVEFFGVEDGGKVHGPGRDILYINEANLISFDIYKQLAIRTNELIIIDYNPADEFSWVYQVADAPGNKIIHSTYRNNLGNLTPEIVAEIESLKDADENLWNVYGLGLRGKSTETIYTHWKPCDVIPAGAEIVYGLDFGYNVPTALVEIGFHENAVYWNEMLYETKLTTGDLVDRLKALGVSRTAVIYCDNAEPKAIEEICRAGYNAKPADKDVTEGIRKVKSKPLYITRSSTNLIKEIRSYKWKVNKDGKVLDEPVKFMDHAVDAGRYGTFTHSIGFKFQIAVA
ncbi:MAG TPA: terminase large subunit [Chitinophagaceae bacterium]|nr:terminase large subunit [Chitinophagaceae bacterium]